MPQHYSRLDETAGADAEDITVQRQVASSNGAFVPILHQLDHNGTRISTSLSSASSAVPAAAAATTTTPSPHYSSQTSISPHRILTPQDTLANADRSPSPSASSNALNDHQVTGTTFSSTANLANTILGSGMLAMPAAMASIGLGLGICVILLSALASALGLHLLACNARKTHGRNSSFFAVASLTYPQATVLFDAAIAIKCFGVSISYLIIFADLMPQVFQSFGLSSWPLLAREFWISVAIIVLIPLAFQRRLDALKYTSIFALASSICLIILVSKFFFFDPDRPSIPFRDIRLVRWSWDFFTHLPVFVFGFTCHQNIFAVYNEMRENSTRAINLVIISSIGLACMVYQWIAVIGYLSFGNNVSENLLLMYGKGPLVILSQLGMALLVLFSYPLQCHPARASIEKIIFVIRQGVDGIKNYEFDPIPDSEAVTAAGDAANPSTTTTTISTTTITTACHSGAVPYYNTNTTESGSNDAGGDEEDGSPLESSDSPTTTSSVSAVISHRASTATHVTITVCLLVLSYIVALSVSNLTLVLSFVGSTGSTTISFILPGLFYYKIHADDPWRPKKCLAALLAAYGLLILVVCLSSNIVTMLF